MYLISRDIQRRMDAYFVDKGYPIPLLMEMAGLAVFDVLKETFLDRRPVALFAGSGNNGGDVLVLARHLSAAAWPFTLYCKQDDYNSEPIESISELTFDDPLPLQHHLLRSAGIYPKPFSAYEPKSNEIIVDGILGSGFDGERGLNQALTDLFNTFKEAQSQGSVVVSVDVPSGLDAERGIPDPAAVMADYTVSLEGSHAALLSSPGCEHAGKVLLRPLEVPYPLVESFWTEEDEQDETLVFSMDESWFKTLDTIPKESAHKGSQGRVVLIAGSERYPGAAILAAEAAQQAGAGYVELVAPKAVCHLALEHRPELIIHDRAKATAEDLDLGRDNTAVILGPGMADLSELQFWFKKCISQSPRLVLDAGVFDLLARMKRDKNTEESSDPANNLWLEQRPDTFPEPILTPHPGEFRRLFGDLGPRMEAVQKAANCSQCTVLLKGSRTLICSAKQNRLEVNLSGNRGLATAGSGDVLAGIIGALYAQAAVHKKGLADPVSAASMGAYLHGAAADYASHKMGPDGLTPSYLLKAISPSLRQLRQTKPSKMQPTKRKVARLNEHAKKQFEHRFVR